MTLREAMKNWISARKAATEAGAKLHEAEKALLAAWDSEQYAAKVPDNWRDLAMGKSSCPRGCPVGELCGRDDCPMRAPVVTYNPPGSGLVELREIIGGEREARIAAYLDKTLAPNTTAITAACQDAARSGTGTMIITDMGVAQYVPPATNVPPGKRMGCTCPPGYQTSCPDVTCPWKPR